MFKWDFRTSAEGRKGLTLDEECNVDPPYASCCRYNDLLPIPNGNAGGDPEYLIRSDRKIGE
jgi:hypothetical protein